ncbi:DUF2254 domain-containing protein [uncultured Thiodictyon sp.]|uniref:DUF2254 domain-containing protein n=1 Tax=uncultured Thiodictyon sp. TaxID=1846217 RepID=UPI0025FB4B1E|nr:DUF2254 domain-containing protein [uncultured Thiodictyon sp.]
MTWQQRYRISRFLRDSIWLAPVVVIVLVLLAHPLVGRLDGILGVKAVIGAETARALLAALASSMLTFIVFVFSIMLVTVQLASAQLTPRIIATFFHSGILRFSLTVFVFAFAFTLEALSQIGDSVPQIAVWVSSYSSAGCIGVFLYLIHDVGKSLRPISVLTCVGNTGQAVIREVYPLTVVATQEAPPKFAPVPEGGGSRTVQSGRTGVVLAFDVAGLVELARRADCLIEFVPQVGAFVTSGDPLFRLHGGGAALADHLLDQSVAIGSERTVEQDPGFAFRIIVDIAAKALSSAINDPTTAVLALDQVHRLLRAVGERQLDTGRMHDDVGRLRLLYRTPDWEDFVALAITEIRLFSGNNIQVVRRLRAMLENLIDTVPPQRAALLRTELEQLDRGVEHAFRDPGDRVRAGLADSLGVGGAT